MTFSLFLPGWSHLETNQTAFCMCGKFTQMMSWGELVRLSDLVGNPTDKDQTPETVTPMRFAHVVTRDSQGQRKSFRMRWGLVPLWAKDPMNSTKHIHARSETIDTLLTFRDAFADRRGILIVSSFNEGKEITPTKTEQYILAAKDGQPCAIAVIWERWVEPHGGELLTFAMITTPPNELIGTITDRMPAVLPESDWPKWLGEEPAAVEELKAMLRPSNRDLDMQKAGKYPPPKPPKPKNDDQPSFL
jgi:putative SOS response-associated peptidase YedK